MKSTATLARPPMLWVFALLLTAGILALGWTWYFWQSSSQVKPSDLEGLQVFYTLPDFSLTDKHNKTITRADLVGKVWVANFIYTHCTDTCPLQSARMADLQKQFPSPDLRFVSISVDPKRDTPAVLTAYARRFRADDRWWFLTGQKTPIYHLVRDGFHLSVEDPSDTAAPTRGKASQRGAPILDQLDGWFVSPAQAHTPSEFLDPPFLHSSWFVLGDRQARIRGYYRTEDDASLRQLHKDLRTLLADRQA